MLGHFVLCFDRQMDGMFRSSFLGTGCFVLLIQFQAVYYLDDKVFTPGISIS